MKPRADAATGTLLSELHLSSESHLLSELHMYLVLSSHRAFPQVVVFVATFVGKAAVAFCRFTQLLPTRGRKGFSPGGAPPWHRGSMTFRQRTTCSRRKKNLGARAHRTTVVGTGVKTNKSPEA